MTMQQIQKTAQTMRNTCTTKTNADPGEYYAKCSEFHFVMYLPICQLQYYD